jgi:hypothetical protein
MALSQQSSVTNKKQIMKCAACGEEGAEMRCGGCHSENYCSGVCQRARWSVHKKECKQIQARMKQLEKGVGEGDSGMGGSGVGGSGVGGSGVGGSGVGGSGVGGSGVGGSGSGVGGSRVRGSGAGGGVGRKGFPPTLSSMERYNCHAQVYNACHNDRRQELGHLLQQSGLDVNWGEPEIGFTAVHAAAEEGHDQCLSMLIRYGGADLAKNHRRGRAPIHTACHKGRIACLLLLLDNGVDLNVLTDDEVPETPAHTCSLAGHVKCLALLLDRGADIESLDGRGSTPLHKACLGGKLKCIQLLLSRGARINPNDLCEFTPLDWARALEHSECIEFLLENNAVGNTSVEDMPFLVSGDMKVRLRVDSSYVFTLRQSCHLMMLQNPTQHRNMLLTA